MFFTFLIVVILTAIALVVAAMTIAKLIAPRSFNPQKGEPYDFERIGVGWFFPWATEVPVSHCKLLCRIRKLYCRYVVRAHKRHSL